MKMDLPKKKKATGPRSTLTNYAVKTDGGASFCGAIK
jgi:hypothetical protein